MSPILSGLLVAIFATMAVLSALIRIQNSPATPWRQLERRDRRMIVLREIVYWSNVAAAVTFLVISGNGSFIRIFILGLFVGGLYGNLRTNPKLRQWLFPWRREFQGKVEEVAS